MVQTTYNFPSATIPSGTNSDYYLPAGGAFINTKGASAVTLYTHRTADTGTATLQAFVEFMFEPLNTWYPLLDFNNATAIQGVQYANDGVDTSTPFYQMLHLQVAPLAVDADYLVILNTIHKLYQVNIPPRIRYRFRNGGTGVTNTFSAMAVLGGVR